MANLRNNSQLSFRPHNSSPQPGRLTLWVSDTHAFEISFYLHWQEAIARIVRSYPMLLPGAGASAVLAYLAHQLWVYASSGHFPSVPAVALRVLLGPYVLLPAGAAALYFYDMPNLKLQDQLLPRARVGFSFPEVHPLALSLIFVLAAGFVPLLYLVLWLLSWPLRLLRYVVRLRPGWLVFLLPVLLGAGAFTSPGLAIAGFVLLGLLTSGVLPVDNQNYLFSGVLLTLVGSLPLVGPTANFVQQVRFSRSPLQLLRPNVTLPQDQEALLVAALLLLQLAFTTHLPRRGYARLLSILFGTASVAVAHVVIFDAHLLARLLPAAASLLLLGSLVLQAPAPVAPASTKKNN